MNIHLLVVIVAFALFIFLFVNEYWKVQLIVNIDQIGTNAHSKFYSSDSDRMSIFRERVGEGEQLIKDKRVVICGMVRNVERNVSKIIKKVERLGKKFQDYAVLVVENDSKDRTRELLLEWVNKNPKVTILGCGINAKSCSIDIAKDETTEHSVTRSRIEKMAFLRNIYLDEIKNFYYDWDLAIIWDLDIVGTVYFEGILNTLSYMKNIPVMCAYGSRCFGDKCIYYDTYAHKDISPSPLEDTVGKDNSVRLNNVHLIGDFPIEVKSCFSGFTIYKIPFLLHENIFYDTNQEIECEHTLLHQKIKDTFDAHIYMNPSMLHLVLNNDY